MKRGLTGHYIPISSAGAEKCRAFVPHPLPPNPPIQLDMSLQDLMERATLALGRFDGMTMVLPDPSLFLYSYVRKEAVLSSQIEGTQSTLSDLLLFENEAAPSVPLDDVREASNYVSALQHGLRRFKEGMPISLRLLKEMHGILLSKGRSSEKEPGEFRRSQNWFGGSRPGNATFVPPPPDYVLDCLGALEKFLHNDPVKTPLLIKAALAHVQFETIHPFLDGNGRIGRLLVSFLVCAEGAIREPMLYLSLFFKKNRQEYYDLLQEVRIHGDWERWIAFFLKGVQETADQAASTARRLMTLAARDEQKVQTLGRAAGSALRVHGFFQRQPLTSIATASKSLNLSFPAVTTALNNLRKLNIVVEVTGKQRSRLFAYGEYLKILSEDTEPLER
jgi:Fic family protein